LLLCPNGNEIAKECSNKSQIQQEAIKAYLEG